MMHGLLRSRAWLIGWCLFAGPGLPAAEPEATRYLIIHADDAGMSHSANRGTIEAMEQGVVSSASILVTAAWFPEFAAYARQHPEGDYGIHLTLTSEWDLYRWGPVAPRAQVPSLVDPDGFLWDNVGQVVQHVKAEEAELELRAQIERARHFGVPLSHLDTHMGALLSRPDLTDVYVKLGIEYQLPVLFLRQIHPTLAREYPGLAARGEALVRQLDQHRLPVLDGVGQFYDGESHEQRRAAYEQYLMSLPPGVSELIIHCGYDDAELRAITNSAARRDGDRRIFTDPQIRRLIESAGIKLITWKQFREMKK